MMLRRRLRSWKERVHDAQCPPCAERLRQERMWDQMLVIYPEPTEEEIDAWLIPDDWSEGEE